MPYYPISNRKTKTKKIAKTTTKEHSRQCIDKSPAKSSSYTKESIREVTVKLMALMKAKRECKTAPAQ